MSKKLEQWLDEFVEKGADPADVSNWPTTAGGGTSVPEYEGPYNIYYNGDIEIAGKKATSNITVAVPLIPDDLDSGYVAYRNGGWAETRDIKDSEGGYNTLNYITGDSYVDVEGHSYNPLFLYHCDSDGNFVANPNFDSSWAYDKVVVFNNQNCDGLGNVDTNELDMSKPYWYDSGLRVVHSIGVSVNDEFAAVGDGSGHYRLIDTNVPEFEEGYVYHIIDCSGEPISFSQLLQPSENVCYHIENGYISEGNEIYIAESGVYYVTVSNGTADKIDMNLPKNIGDNETVTINGVSYIFTRTA